MEKHWAIGALHFLSGHKTQPKPSYQLLPLEAVRSAEVVDGPREDGTCVIQRYRGGVPDGSPEVDSLSALAQRIDAFRRRQ